MGPEKWRIKHVPSLCLASASPIIVQSLQGYNLEVRSTEEYTVQFYLCWSCHGHFSSFVKHLYHTSPRVLKKKFKKEIEALLDP